MELRLERVVHSDGSWVMENIYFHLGEKIPVALYRRFTYPEETLKSPDYIIECFAKVCKYVAIDFDSRKAKTASLSFGIHGSGWTEYPNPLSYGRQM